MSRCVGGVVIWSQMELVSLRPKTKQKLLLRMLGHVTQVCMVILTVILPLPQAFALHVLPGLLFPGVYIFVHCDGRSG